jgi:hypothetical protein
MKYIYQKHTKDCLQATLSNLLSLPYSIIPEFYKYYENEDKDKWINMLTDFLDDHGYFRILLNVRIENDLIMPINIYNNSPLLCIGILEKKGRNYAHAVLLEYLNNNFTIIHDPKRNTEYDIRDLIQIELILKK